MNCRKELALGILVASAGLFLFACSGPAVEETPTKELPTEPLSTGDAAPNFTLPDADGNMVSLADQLLDNRLVILVFYHAYD